MKLEGNFSCSILNNLQLYIELIIKIFEIDLLEQQVEPFFISLRKLLCFESLIKFAQHIYGLLVSCLFATTIQHSLSFCPELDN